MALPSVHGKAGTSELHCQAGSGLWGKAQVSRSERKAQVFNLPFQDEDQEANEAVCLASFDHGAS
jgi:hypothetical protein